MKNLIEIIDLGSVQNRGYYRSKRAEGILRGLSRPGGIIIEHHVLKSLQEQGIHLNPNIDNKSRYNPEELFLALAKYGRPKSVKEGVFTSPLFKDACAITMKKFGGNGDLEPLLSQEQFYEAIKQEKSSGAPLFTSKGEAFERDYQRMLRFARGSVAAEPCVAYHRVQHGETGPKTRLVWGYPLHMTLLESKYASPLIKKFLKLRVPMAFGLHRHELAARLVPIDNSGIRMCFDFSSYDASIEARLIDFAFKVLRTHFTSVVDLEWDRMVHYFIHTPILMPNGQVYVKHKGVPSGSFWTNLIGSIVNFLCVTFASLVTTGKPIEEGKILVLGDDGIIGLDVFIPLPKWASVFRSVGLTLNVLKSELTRRGVSYTFLGHSWDRGLVNRDIKQLAKRMAFPERIIKIEDPRIRILSRVLAYGSDALNAHVIISKWSVYKGPQLVAIYNRDVLAEPFLGWREIVPGDRTTLTFPKGALDNAYVGILV